MQTAIVKRIIELAPSLERVTRAQALSVLARRCDAEDSEERLLTMIVDCFRKLSQHGVCRSFLLSSGLAKLLLDILISNNPSLAESDELPLLSRPNLENIAKSSSQPRPPAMSSIMHDSISSMAMESLALLSSKTHPGIFQALELLPSASALLLRAWSSSEWCLRALAVLISAGSFCFPDFANRSPWNLIIKTKQFQLLGHMIDVDGIFESDANAMLRIQIFACECFNKLLEQDITDAEQAAVVELCLRFPMLNALEILALQSYEAARLLADLLEWPELEPFQFSKKYLRTVILLLESQDLHMLNVGVQILSSSLLLQPSDQLSVVAALLPRDSSSVRIIASANLALSACNPLSSGSSGAAGTLSHSASLQSPLDVLVRCILLLDAFYRDILDAIDESSSVASIAAVQAIVKCSLRVIEYRVFNGGSSEGAEASPTSGLVASRSRSHHMLRTLSLWSYLECVCSSKIGIQQLIDSDGAALLIKICLQEEDLLIRHSILGILQNACVLFGGFMLSALANERFLSRLLDLILRGHWWSASVDELQGIAAMPEVGRLLTFLCAGDLSMCDGVLNRSDFMAWFALRVDDNIKRIVSLGAMSEFNDDAVANVDKLVAELLEQMSIAANLCRCINGPKILLRHDIAKLPQSIAMLLCADSASAGVFNALGSAERLENVKAKLIPHCLVFLSHISRGLYADLPLGGFKCSEFPQSTRAVVRLVVLGTLDIIGGKATMPISTLHQV